MLALRYFSSKFFCFTESPPAWVLSIWISQVNPERPTQLLCALCKCSVSEVICSYELGPAGRVRHTSFPFAGTVLAREVHYKHTSFPDPGRKISLLMVTHSTLGLCSGDVFKRWFVLVQSIKNIINQICSEISGTCCRQDTLGLLLLHWQVSAYRSMHIAARFMLWMKTVGPGLPVYLAVL